MTVHYRGTVRVLLADGDRGLVASLKRILSDEGHLVDVALNGEHALWHALEFDYDAALLDVRLPGLDGVEVARRLRDRKPATPILMLVSGHDDLVALERRIDEGGTPEGGTPESAGRECGAGPIARAAVAKPIDIAGLTARLNGLASVPTDCRVHELRVEGLRMRPDTRQAWRGDSELTLSPREYAMLQLFLTRPGQVLTRRQILDHVWARNHDKAPNLVDQYVLYLRRKVDRPFAVIQLETVRGVGYRLRERPAPDPLARLPESRHERARSGFTCAGH